MSIINNHYVWIIGRQIYNVYRSTDFGNNFDSVGYVTGGYEIYTVRFRNNLTGWCGGGGTPAGRMFKTTNGGFTWQQYDNTISCYFGDFWFHNDGVGWAVGSNGVILNTTNGGISYVNQLSSNIPENFKLYQNYPNPFNSVSSIKYQVLKSSNMKLIVFNILGKEVVTLVNEKQTPGIYEVHFDGVNLSTGIYFYSLLVNGKIIDTKKLVLLK